MQKSSTLAALLGLGFRFLDQATLDHLVEDLMSTAIGQQLLNQSYQGSSRPGRGYLRYMPCARGDRHSRPMHL